MINRFCVLLYYEFSLANISPLRVRLSHCHGREPSIELTFDFMMFLTSSTDVVGRDPRIGGDILK